MFLRPVAAFALLGALIACSAHDQRATQQSAQSALTSAAVQAKLTAIDADAATQVHVSVGTGVATLRGVAHSDAERRAYTAAAATVSGVNRVVDRLSVAPGARGPRETLADAALATKVNANIAAQAGINITNVHTSVRDGVVTLDGAVATPALKATIDDVVRKTSGVKTVIDRLQVKR